MGIIYEIICWTTGLRYIGKTTTTLKRRLVLHKSDFKTGRCLSSSLVLEHGNYDIYQLEKVEDESKLSEREYYYIQHSDCVNIVDNTFDVKNHKKNTRYKYKEYAKEYEAKNLAIKIVCPCGITHSKRKQARHNKTQTHQNYLANLQNNSL